MPITFKAKLHRPLRKDEAVDWTFLNLPQEASDQLPSRSMVSVEGTANAAKIVVTLEPDGKGGHWLKVEPELQETIRASPGDVVSFSVMPTTEEPEPKVPTDFLEALQSNLAAFDVWNDITALARRDWIAWVTSGKKAETRTKRIAVACDKLAKGMRRACCFDRSGMYSNSLSCPVPDLSE